MGQQSWIIHFSQYYPHLVGKETRIQKCYGIATKLMPEQLHQLIVFDIVSGIELIAFFLTFTNFPPFCSPVNFQKLGLFNDSWSKEESCCLLKGGLT